MIQRIRIQGYKSLDDLEVPLRPLSVLFGPNAAGKSNFLDALQLLSRLVTARTLKEAFEAPYRGTPLESFTFGPKGIAGQIEKEKLECSFEVDVELSASTIEKVEREVLEMRRGNDRGDNGHGTGETKAGGVIKERFLRYCLTLEVSPRSGILRVARESLAALRSNGELKASRGAFLETKVGAERQRLHLSLRMEGQAHPTYHDIGLDHTLVSRPLYPPHYPHLVAFREELAGWRVFYFEPRERMRAANPVKEARHVGMMGEDLAAFLNTLKTLDRPQFRAVERAMQTLIPRIESIEVEPNSLGEVELRLVEDGLAVPARLLSEGTLRMLGLLAVGGAREQPTLVALEEPENGVHPRRIALIARFLESRSAGPGGPQFVATTHSPILPDLLPSDSLFVCRREAGATRIEPFSPAHGELWRKQVIDDVLHDPADGRAPISARILRGDFDA